MFYTLCFTNKEILNKPFALFEGVSKNHIEKKYKKHKSLGDFLFLPKEGHISIRKSSETEIKLYLSYLKKNTPKIVLPNDDENSYKAQQRSFIFFQKLWRNEIKPSKRNSSDSEEKKKSSSAGSSSGSGGIENFIKKEKDISETPKQRTDNTPEKYPEEPIF